MDGKGRGGIGKAWVMSGGAFNCDTTREMRKLRICLEELESSDVRADHFLCCII